MNFIKRVVYDLLFDIYAEENDIRKYFGSEYVEKYGIIDPKTGKKRISAKKIAAKIIGFLIFLMIVFILVRITQKGFWISYKPYAA
ncbi:MAG: hypothetical protein FWD71_03200 [Oscillospiraceae bacterium]|nr:hypothetical protein [Oscillospiraceae bacterium]